ncbi:MAG: rRNA maturation RNase YbeY [Paludibacter sp.]|nr:rRNA maturation RNase YbeY [Paludibacter sp.]
MILYVAEDVALPKLQKHKINSWIKETAAEYNRKIGEIAYIFCSDKRILEVNKQYLEHDYYTDIITFDDSKGSIISGDIFISIETIASNANEFKVSFEIELQRIMIHGILHLCGQDDKMPEQRIEMTRKENLALKRLHDIMFF